MTNIVYSIWHINGNHWVPWYIPYKYSMSIKHSHLCFTPLTNFEYSANTFHSLHCIFVIILHNAVIVHGSCTAKTDLLKMKQYIPSLFYFTGHDLASWWDSTCTYRIMPAWFLGCGYKSIQNYVILSLKPYLYLTLKGCHQHYHLIDYRNPTSRKE